ncbi:hypothetical protein CMI47_18885 [Candidatus Pacearchaeota archaeon]|nr:hypothetical protein [Candidatus Pacearchaeota archaeon]|tara:strand:+ start:283 stop:477 length:195 start_codon:yes stop_codon:yes gene_type:complete
MNSLKELLKKWKVEVTLVGGALVVATAYGRCVYEPVVESSDDAEVAQTTEDTTTTTTAETTDEN